MADTVIEILKRAKIPHTTEEEMQVAIFTLLTTHKIEFTREYSLSKRDRVDFLTGDGIAIECKTKGQPLTIHRQLERYAESDMVKAIVLFSSKFMNVKPTINGKPAMVIHAGKSWL